MQLHYQLTPQDLAAYQYAVRDRVDARAKLDGSTKRHAVEALLLTVAILAVALACVSAWPAAAGREFELVESIIGFFTGVLFALAAIWLNFFQQRRSIVKPDGPTLSPHTLAIEADGLRISGTHLEHTFAWPIFEDLTELQSILVLWLEPAQGLIVPRSAFANDREAASFAEEIRGHIARARLGL
jgi:hypothetical protein